MNINVKPGQEDAALAQLAEIQRLARADAGNQLFLWLHHTTDPTRFTLCEQWDTQADLDKHLVNISPAWDRFTPLLAGTPVSEPVAPVTEIDPQR
ncbi:hypothetical protein BKG77_01600 [Mycobacteroides chelonae]|nr:hypothetical protein BKG77_01600 [Mycobacteroides chelonae]OHU63691.1 hypothetical protein BKG85_09315 [Mycobacteroides chelonae]